MHYDPPIQPQPRLLINDSAYGLMSQATVEPIHVSPRPSTQAGPLSPPPNNRVQMRDEKNRHPGGVVIYSCKRTPFPLLLILFLLECNHRKDSQPPTKWIPPIHTTSKPGIHPNNEMNKVSSDIKTPTCLVNWHSISSSHLKQQPHLPIHVPSHGFPFLHSSLPSLPHFFTSSASCSAAIWRSWHRRLW